LLCGNDQKMWSSDFETYILKKQKRPENSMLKHAVFRSFLLLQIRLLERLLWLLLKANFCQSYNIVTYMACNDMNKYASII